MYLQPRLAYLLFPVLAAVTAGAADTFSVNFWRSGGGAHDWASFLTLAPDQSAGSGDWQSAGWQNYELPWAPASPQRPKTITSNQGANATLVLNDTRNGGPYRWQPPRTTLLGDANGTMMDGHANSTEDPGDSSNIFDMEVSDVPFAAYDVVIYMGANSGQFGDGSGRIVFNGGAEQRFTLKPGAFDGTFTEISDAATAGNYFVFSGVTGSTFTTQVWGNGFNHIGPCGIQIIETDQAREPLEITDVVYDEDTGEVTLTWKSNPGEQYGIHWGEDLHAFVPGIAPSISAHPTETRTTYGPFPSPGAGSAELFFRIGAPDLEDPTLDRVWGVGTTVTLSFSEPMHPAAATNPANFSVGQDDARWLITSAALSPDGKTVTLTTAPDLALDADYTVQTYNLQDLAGRPLDSPTTTSFQTWDDNPRGVKVFILAGQSNMQGHGRNETGLGGVSGAIGSLRYQVDNDPDNYGQLVGAGGNWISRSDVQVWWRDSDLAATRSVKKGRLSPNFGVDNGKFGPELGFGWILGDLYDQPVLLIKACWGGKSLYADFRPPSAAASRGGKVGTYYTGMFDYVHDALDNIDTEFPEWAGMGYEIAGFGWHQGWNDGGDDFPASQYEENLADLITDVRAEFGKPGLPVSVANTGIGGWDARGTRVTIMEAQLAVGDPAQHPGFAGTVSSAETRDFWRESGFSPVNQSYHWNQNGETYFLIGDALGKAMKDLLSNP